jgi:HAD superfamily hydrolase (TIGR01509 family)
MNILLLVQDEQRVNLDTLYQGIQEAARERGGDCDLRRLTSKQQENLSAYFSENIDVSKYNFINFNDSIKECFYKFKHPRIRIENKSDFFICLDLDGTILETNIAHYNCYKKVFENHNKKFITIDKWDEIIMNDNIDNYLMLTLNENEFNIFKKEKRQLMKDEQISFTKNSDEFITFLINNNFNFCVVTNTNKETIEIFKIKLPLLNNIKNWISREDYNLPKPDSECYEVAKQLYYKNEKYIVGFEDSVVGYNALKNITDIIYVFDNEDIFKNKDCFLLNDFRQLLDF